jgi:ribosomal-protein-alanine N-acetyltransferase
MISNINNIDISLEVRSSNEEAINFYKKNKFMEVAIRKNYYGNEDAILMVRSGD